jgi:putative hydrolase of the HAD superfamily
MKEYKDIFFDLDRTLWDFERNLAETFRDLYDEHRLVFLGIDDFDKFFEVYRKINFKLWDEYRKGEITKNYLKVERYHRALLEFGVDERGLATALSRDYIRLSPMKTNLLPNTIEILEYLEPKYNMHIITNGFEEVQRLKLERSGLRKYFDKIIISERAGYKKPSPEIFRFSVIKAGAKTESSIMIGDDLAVDIKGAKDFGMDQVWFNYTGEGADFKPLHTIRDLSELKQIL